MKFLKFKLSGEVASFVKPAKTKTCLYTFQHIHKVALMGLIGATIGLNGYETSFKVYPEFYDKLKDIQIAIIPTKPSFKKNRKTLTEDEPLYKKYKGKVQQIQQLINPSWWIYIPLECNSLILQFYKKLENKESVYKQRLGSKDCPAVISDVGIIDLRETKISKTNCLISEEYVKFIPRALVCEDISPVKLKPKQGYIYKKIHSENVELKTVMEGYVDGRNKFILM